MYGSALVQQCRGIDGHGSAEAGDSGNGCHAAVCPHAQLG